MGTHTLMNDIVFKIVFGTEQNRPLLRALINALHTTYRFYDPIQGRELSDILEMHFVELVKFKKDRPEAQWSPLEKWLHILKFGEVYESGVRPVPEVLKDEEGIEMVLDAMKKAYSRDDVREMIEFRLKAEHDEATRMARARRQALAEGRAEGRAEGIAEGIEKGKAEGIHKGRAQGLQEAARRMLEQGMDRETVLRILGLPPEAIP